MVASESPPLPSNKTVLLRRLLPSIPRAAQWTLEPILLAGRFAKWALPTVKRCRGIPD